MEGGKGGKWEEETEKSAPTLGGRGMQDIAAPRDTQRRRNLHDGGRRRITIPRSSNYQVTRFPVHEWPILLGLSLGKSLSIPITAPPLPPSSLAQNGGWCSTLGNDEHHRSFTLVSQRAACLGRRLRRTKISFFTRRQGPRRRVQERRRRRRRNASCVADFFHYSS